MSRNQRKVGHYELYSYPEKIEHQLEDARYKRLLIASVNDFQGNISPQKYALKDSLDSKQYIYSGGISALKSYLDILREEYKDELVLADAGSFLALKDDHQQTVFLYNYLGLDVVNMGTNEFSLSTGRLSLSKYLTKLFSQARFKIINANLYDLKRGEKANWNFKRPHYIKEFNGVKVGFIGVYSQELAHKNLSSNLNGFYFQNLAKVIIEEANQLGKSGAQVIVLLAHHGIDCTSLLAKSLDLPHLKVNFDSKDISGCESTNNELVKTLSLLPPQKIDLVITGGISSKVVNTFYGIPVIQNFGEGNFFSFVELYYDTKLHRVATEKTKLHQPVQACHNFLNGTNDCFVEDEDTNELTIPAKFLGKTINILPLPQNKNATHKSKSY